MPRDPDMPRLTFSPRGWLKWQYLCHCGPTEIGAFGLSKDSDLLYVDDLIVLKQSATAVSVAFDDAAVADLFDEMADAGIPSNRFSRIWLHTHPGASVTPSGVDEETFRRVFGANDWAVMGILGRTGRTSARLRFNSGPGGALEIPTAVDWGSWPAFAESYDLQLSVEHWREEYDRLVHSVNLLSSIQGCEKAQANATSPVAAGFDAWLFGDDPFFNSDLLHER